MKTKSFSQVIVKFLFTFYPWSHKYKTGFLRHSESHSFSSFRLFDLRFFLPFAFCLITSALFSQAPQGFNYQAVVRDANGQMVKDQAVSLRLTLLQGSETGTVVYSETHQVTTSPVGLVTMVVGEGNVESGDFAAIDWEEGPYYLKVEADLAGGSDYELLGVSALMSVPYALQAGTVGSLTRLEVQGDDPDTEEALFEVKRKDGQTVFAVYNEGVRIYVDTASGAKGPRRSGFAIGGFDFGKGVPHEYLRVTPDSVRIYIDDSDNKGPRRGGFAIGGFDFGKGGTREYLRVTDDSTRVYVKEPDNKGPRRGGFAIGGFDFGKGDGMTEYFNVSTSSSADVVGGENRVLWYPRKNAFLVGRVLVEGPDSVGTNSMVTGFESKALGDYSQAFGYKCVTTGPYAMAIGKMAKADSSSFAFGKNAIADGNESFAFGSGSRASGLRSFSFGSVGLDSLGNPMEDYPTMASGNYSIAMGLGASAEEKGSMSFGVSSHASREYALSIGYGSVANGRSSLALGSRANYFESVSYPAPYVYSHKKSNYVTGDFGISIGSGNTAGAGATALGLSNYAWNWGSMALGFANEAKKDYAFAAGYRSEATGKFSTAIGNYTVSQAFNSFVIGSFNTISGDPDNWVDTDPLFVIGNGENKGTSTVRSDAFKVLKNGNTFVYGGLYVTNDIKTSSALISDQLILGSYNYYSNVIPSLTLKEYHRIPYPNYTKEYTLKVSGKKFIVSDENVDIFSMYNGNVGVGTIFPAQKLDVAGDARITGGDVMLWLGTKAVCLRQDSQNSYISNRQNFVGNGASSNGRLILNGEAGVSLRYGVGTSSGYDGLILDNQGRVGIGRTTPNYKLHVQDSRSSSYIAWFSNTSGSTPHGIAIQVANHNASVAFVGCKTYNQHLGGLYCNSSGQIYLSGTSDARLKKDIEDTRVNALEILKGIKVRDFYFINRPTDQKITGFVAQEVMKVLPDMVVYDKDGEFISQYQSDKFSDLKDMAINEEAKLLYLLDNNLLYAYQLSHLEE
jgi:hypothetical protein